MSPVLAREPKVVADAGYRSILETRLLTDAARHVQGALLRSGRPLSAVDAATAANVSSSFARKVIYWLEQLGYASRSVTKPEGRAPIAEWRLNRDGAEFALRDPRGLPGMIVQPAVDEDTAQRAKALRQLDSESGRAVTRALASKLGGALRTGQVAELSGVSATCVRQHVYRLMRLGFVRQCPGICPSNGRRIAAWQITPVGFSYARSLAPDDVDPGRLATGVATIRGAR